MNPEPSAHPVPANDTPAVPNSVTPQVVEVSEDNQLQRDAAVSILRSKIDTLYQTGTPHVEAEPKNPYARTHAQHVDPTADQWKQYHTAWQNYYQKYYERYYTEHLKKSQASLAAQKQSALPDANGIFSKQLDTPTTPRSESISKDEALLDLRSKLRSQVTERAKKFRRSKHFVPLTAAIIVILLFVFLQYNRTFIAGVQAYVSPGSIDPQNIVIDPSAAIAVGPESRLIIPKINVDVPVVYDVGNDHDSQMAAMEKGVAHFAIPGADSHPGEFGNTVIAGHSSNDLFDPGDYKFIFAQLERLQTGDSIYANYGGIRYTYIVTQTETVRPSQVDKLVYTASKPNLILITCTPVGTALNRFLVTAEQVSPDPTASDPAPVSSSKATSTGIPGNSPTLLERLFGA
ncbi:MAG: putative sortase [Candidatus Saccharibacteria bacterium]|nr:putative sortase [Candidatus Saccharibacteria bacterium]